MQQLQNAVLRLGTGLGIVAIEAVQTGASVGVDQGDARLFVHQVFERGNQGQVLEHIRMVAGMKGVAVTEHGLMVTKFHPRP